jgi:hypothetical protein
MTSPGGKPTALACRPTKKVNKAEELTYISTNIDYRIVSIEIRFLHLKLLCWLFMGPTLGFDTKQRSSFFEQI